MGILVVDWPLVPGCDGAGVVVKAGNNAVNPFRQLFNEGEEVCGCTRLRMKGYAPWQEYFLMDAAFTIPKPKNIDLAQASTLGDGALTAFLGIFDNFKIPLLHPKDPFRAKDEWILVFGGASSTGKMAVQTLKARGYKVLTTCSAKSFELLKSLGADATIDYKKTEAEIIEEIKSHTSSSLAYIFDAVATNSTLAPSIFSALPSSNSAPRYFTTTNDWNPLPDSPDFASSSILTGLIGRPDAKEFHDKIASYIPIISALIKDGKLTPSDYVIGGEGLEGLKGALKLQQSGKAGSKKVIVEVGEVYNV